MSVAVCRSSAVPFLLEKEGIGTMAPMAPNSIQTNTWLPPASELHKTLVDETNHSNKVEENPGQFDIWSMIQSQKSATNSTPAPYIHPLMRRSSSLMSQKSLEMCTESLGSETGSDDFSSSFSELEDNAPFPWSSSSSDETEQEVLEQHQKQQAHDEEEGEDKVRRAFGGRKELSSVNYHCSIGRRSQPRSFPPPLPSISRRDGPCLSMRPHRRDGRLVVEAVPVPSQNYLHARRQEGRLLLTFIDATSHRPSSDTNITAQSQDIKQEIQVDEVEMQQLEEDEQEAEEKVCYEEEEEEEEEDEEEDEEEEVEVVDRGTVVEVKVSTQPQQQSGGAMRVHRSSLVINKFVGGAPMTNQNRWTQHAPPRHEEEEAEGVGSRPPTPPHRRGVATTTTAAAAAVAASSTISASSEAAAMGERPASPDNKLLFTSKRRNREELLHHMRRCSELRRPLFFWEPCCIATSS